MKDEIFIMPRAWGKETELIPLLNTTLSRIKAISLASFSENISTREEVRVSKDVDCLTFLFRAKNEGLDPVLRGFSAVRVVKNVCCLSSLISLVTIVLR
jgi:hypothetical protein